MFNSITWELYFLIITMSLFVYYLFLWFVFYHNRRIPLLNINENRKGKNLITKELNDTSLPDMVRSFSNEISAYLSQVGENKIEKDKLLNSFSIIANKYFSLSKSEYKETLNQYIKDEAELHCAVLLSDSEVRGIWDRT